MAPRQGAGGSPCAPTKDTAGCPWPAGQWCPCCCRSGCWRAARPTRRSTCRSQCHPGTTTPGSHLIQQPHARPLQARARMPGARVLPASIPWQNHPLGRPHSISRASHISLSSALSLSGSHNVFPELPSPARMPFAREAEEFGSSFTPPALSSLPGLSAQRVQLRFQQRLLPGRD